MRVVEGVLYLSKADCAALLAHTARDKYLKALNCVKFEAKDDKVHAVATDGHRLVCATCPGQVAGGAVLREFLERAIRCLVGRELLALRFEPSGVTIGSAASEDGSLKFGVGFNLADVVFPDWRKVIPKPSNQGAAVIGLNPALLSAVSLVSKATGRAHVRFNLPKEELAPIGWEVSGNSSDWTGVLMPARL